MALRMLEAVDENDAEARLELRVGIATGPVVAGVIRSAQVCNRPLGRHGQHREPGRIQVTEATAALLQERFVLEERGAIAVKGRGELRTWWLVGRK
jgi:class 3 adenylate cyclase